MPIFTRQLNKVSQDPAMAIRQMENHIRYIQEQLEYTLVNLDSSNVTEIETDKTTITNSEGSMNISSDFVSLSGKNGESFKAGYDTTAARFVFEVKGAKGRQYLYINNNGDLVITSNATIAIDCGEW